VNFHQLSPAGMAWLTYTALLMAAALEWLG
jgi:hypothetical protein